MGVSIEMYRINIGTFQSNQVQRKKLCTIVKKCSLKCVLLLCFLLFNTHWIFALSEFQVEDRFNVPQNNYCRGASVIPSLSTRQCWSDEVETDCNLNINFVLMTDVNFNARYVNGNRRNKGLKITHWNLGSAYLGNKIHEIETLVADFHPHILGISEANYFRSQSGAEVMLDEYELIPALTMDNPNLNVSRVVIYKHKSVVVKLRKDLMCDNFSSIWVEVGLPKQKKILVCHFYREHQYLGQKDMSSLAHSE